MSQYDVKFKFNMLHKKSRTSRGSGEINITTEKTPEILKKDEELIDIIKAEMTRKTKQVILSVEITEIVPA